ncbi:hypothetical protein HNO92_001481 [Chromobacterium alkanivorans]|uniref:AHH domain-containing protein n=1 Tax=Chromobacterium alkanivorans TaxID=1071719 RepID=UPI002167C9EF|nr:AHH domain-containing protein [Chromobacterium alkanivorans]MCS3804619.1 hypothetical protein [Chromobacterium alkanivorans]MCS3818958.1 hypothetical protein [Chromobacterium alkanivorans]MCS3873184.1 hypothetical protein [Chromobacterium alkanivorans]
MKSLLKLIEITANLKSKYDPTRLKTNDTAINNIKKINIENYTTQKTTSFYSYKKQSLKGNTLPVLPGKFQQHHIFPQQFAKEPRYRIGVDFLVYLKGGPWQGGYNSSANIIPLPSNGTNWNGAPTHTGKHSDSYKDEMKKTLEELHNILAILQIIKQNNSQQDADDAIDYVKNNLEGLDVNLKSEILLGKLLLY